MHPPRPNDRPVHPHFSVPQKLSLPKRQRSRGFSLPELMISVVIVGVLGALGSSSFKEKVAQSKSLEAVAMIGSVQKSVDMTIGGSDASNASSLNFSKSYGSAATFGKPTDEEKAAKKSGGESEAEPAVEEAASEEAASEEKSNNGGGNKDGGIDGDGNKGHGNNDDQCDPDNPNYDKKGCEGSSSGGSGLCGSADPVPSSFSSVTGKTYRASASDYGGDSESGWQCLHVSRNGSQHYQYGYEVGEGTVSGASEGYTAWARGDLDGDGRSSYFRARGNLVNGSVVNSPAIEIVDSAE